jgi:predicted nucleotidyltransferase
MFYLDLLRALDRHAVDYVIVGGVAAVLHGVERATMDIDLAVATDARNIAAAVAALRELDMQPAIPVSWDDVLKPGQIDRWIVDQHLIALAARRIEGYAPTVDLLVRSPVPFGELRRRSVVKRLAGLDVPVACIDDLIALKTDTGRRIDAADIESLRRLARLGGDGA